MKTKGRFKGLELSKLMDQTGMLVVGRLKGNPGKFMMRLVNIEHGHILESSQPLTDDELRGVLAKNYGESDSQIEARIQHANAYPEI